MQIKAIKLILNELRSICPVSPIAVFLLIIHVARHTFATLTITAGADIFTTSKLLGHTNVHTTEIYADVVMNTKVDAVNLVSGFFG